MSVVTIERAVNPKGGPLDTGPPEEELEDVQAIADGLKERAAIIEARMRETAPEARITVDVRLFAKRRVRRTADSQLVLVKGVPRLASPQRADSAMMARSICWP